MVACYWQLMVMVSYWVLVGCFDELWFMKLSNLGVFSQKYIHSKVNASQIEKNPPLFLCLMSMSKKRTFSSNFCGLLRISELYTCAIIQAVISCKQTWIRMLLQKGFHLIVKKPKSNQETSFPPTLSFSSFFYITMEPKSF